MLKREPDAARKFTAFSYEIWKNIIKKRVNLMETIQHGF